MRGGGEEAVEPAEEATLSWWSSGTGLSKVAHKAGVSDKARKAENNIDATIDIENWR